MGNVICCPTCHAEVSLAGMGLRECPSCGQAYELKDGFVDFTPAEDFYWGEISREKMAQVNARAVEQDWLSGVLEEVVAGGRENLAGYLLDPQRIAGLFHYYDPEENEACLDLGSGWGPISFGLSRYYRTVYSLDGVADRLTFQVIRARQDGVENVRIMKGSMLKLPLADNSMSVVIVNGLLEWIGLSDPHGDPRRLQVAFLREVRRVLKPGGKIFIGIENRIGPQFFLGSLDHSGIRYTSLAPRWLANWMVRVKKKHGSLVYTSQAYRTYTYTAWGYRKLLREGKFDPPALYWTWPSYNEPYVSGTLDASSIRAYLHTLTGKMPSPMKRWLIRVLGWLPDVLLGALIHTFAPHFMIVASKAPRKAGLQERVMGTGAPKRFLRLSQPDRRKLTSIYQQLDGRRVRRVVSVVIDEQDGASTNMEEINGRPVQANSSQDARRVASWMVEFQQHNGQGWWKAGELQTQIEHLVASAQARLPGQSTERLLERFAQRYIEQITATQVPKVPEHGKLTPANVLVTEAGQVQAVHLDGLGKTPGHPFMDSGAYLLALLSAPCPPAAAAFEQSYAPEPCLPLRLAPAYYILREIERELSPESGERGSYLLRRSWRQRLELALRYALEE